MIELKIPEGYEVAWEVARPVCPKCFAELAQPAGTPKSSLTLPVECCGQIIRAMFYRPQTPYVAYFSGKGPK